MFFIFGWGRTTIKYFGKVMPLKCGKCNNIQYWNLIRKRKWFTLFFIPVIPYENNYYLICPICNNGILLFNDQVEKAKQLIIETDKFLDKSTGTSQETYLDYVRKANLLN